MTPIYHCEKAGLDLRTSTELEDVIGPCFRRTVSLVFLGDNDTNSLSRPLLSIHDTRRHLVVVFAQAIRPEEPQSREFAPYVPHTKTNVDSIRGER